MNQFQYGAVEGKKKYNDNLTQGLARLTHHLATYKIPW